MATGITLWCVHGNVGLPEDWTLFLEALRLAAVSHVNFRCINLWDDDALCADDTPAAWAFRFNERVRSHASDGLRIIVGYSLGGRLAMQAIAADPSLWSAAVLVSSHPGGLSEVEKQQRTFSDEAWARRLEEPDFGWDRFLRDWDNQPIFSSPTSGGSLVSQGRAALLPSKVAAAFRAWSLARMTISLSDAAKLRIPILWLAGLHDAAMCGHHNRLRPGLPNHVQLRTVDSGHRIPLEAPGALAKVIGEFLRDSLKK